MPNAGDDPSKVHDVWSAKEPIGHFICPQCGHYTVRHAAPETARHAMTPERMAKLRFRRAENDS